MWIAFSAATNLPTFPCKPTKFETSVNIRAAAAIGLKMPAGLSSPQTK
jgi:hypothetical protein